MNVRVDVARATEDDSIPDTGFIRDWVKLAVESANKVQNAEVSVRIVDAEEMQALNRDYRHRNSPTNVLSFPAGPVAGLPDSAPGPLGDVVVCADVVRSEAAAQGKDEASHWAHLLVHGTLHLLGFDHETQSGAAEMEALEARILAERGIPDPYGAAGETC